MTLDEEIAIVNKYSDKILELIKHAEEFTTSDVQNGADTIVKLIILELQE